MMMPERDETAAGWVVKMDGKHWSDADEVALQAWLAADRGNSGALLKAQALWATFGGTEAEAVIGAEKEVRDREHGASPPRMVSRRWALAGGGAAIAASVGGVLVLRRDESYATAIGEVRRVPLQDGSVASINTDSAVSVEMLASARRIELAKGEAWFQVARNPERPFIVSAGRVRVQALGTAFSVRRRADGADILVTEGVVEGWADGAEGRKIRLIAGERAFIADNAEIRQARSQPGEMDRALAWRSGKIDLVSMPLSAAVAEFNRYNRRKIVVLDPAVDAEQLDGVFGINDPETFAVAVRDGLSVDVDLTDPAVIRIGSDRK